MRAGAVFSITPKTKQYSSVDSVLSVYAVLVSKFSIGQYTLYWSVFSAPVPYAAGTHCPLFVASLFVVRCSLLPGSPELVDAPPRIRVIRLESLPRARRGGPPHPARNLTQLAIVNPLRTEIRCGTLGFLLVNKKRFSPQSPEDTKGVRS